MPAYSLSPAPVSPAAPAFAARARAALTLLALGAALVGGCARSRAPAEPSSLLLVTLDTCRRDYLGCYGGLPTPTLDGLAREGVLFEDAVASAPLTLPSHASILTGLYPTRHGVRDNGRFRLDERFTTLAEVLRARGYATGAAIGAFPVASTFGLAQGFDTYEEDLTAGRGTGTSFRERRAEAVNRAALGWLAGLGTGPFFLWVHYFDPHQPYDPPSPWREQYARNLYGGEVAYVDAELGALLDELERLGRRRNLLIAVTADHGESLGEHQETTHGLFLYDAAIRVPLLIAAPPALERRVERGRRVTEIVELVDVMPTLLDLLGIPAPPDLDGRSLVPLLKGRAPAGPASPAPERYAYSETFFPFFAMGWSELRSLRSAEWKYIAAPRPELYHLTVDSRELQNLASLRPEVAERMAAALAARSRRDRPAPAQPLDVETLAKLRSLGYIGRASTPAADTSAGAGTSGSEGAPAGAPDPKDMVGVYQDVLSGEEYLSQHQPGKAASLLRQAVNRDPRNEMGRLFLAQALLEMGKPAGAEQEFAHVLELNATSAEARAGRAAALFALGRQAEAESELRRALDERPTYGLAHYNLARIEGARGKADLARQLMEQALRESPYLAEGWMRLGEMHAREARWAEARAAFERALAIAPDDSAAARALAAAIAREGGSGR